MQEKFSFLRMTLFLQLDEVSKLVCNYLNDTYRCAHMKIENLHPTEWKPIFDKCAADILDNLGKTVNIDTYYELDEYYFKMYTTHFDNIDLNPKDIAWRKEHNYPSIGDTVRFRNVEKKVIFMGIMTFQCEG